MFVAEVELDGRSPPPFWAFELMTDLQHKKTTSKASRAIMASSEENIDFKKLLYWKQSSVENPARVGGGYREFIFFTASKVIVVH